MPPPEKRERERERETKRERKKGVKREGKGNADDLCCGVWCKADSNVRERETIKAYTENEQKKIE